MAHKPSRNDGHSLENSKLSTLGVRDSDQAERYFGNLAITLISKSKPASQVTPRAVTVG